MEKKEFETFREFGNYEVSSLKKDRPSAINFLSYRKTKVTIELIDEPTDVLIERLKQMLDDPENNGYNTRSRIINEIKKLSNPH